MNSGALKTSKLKALDGSQSSGGAFCSTPTLTETQNGAAQNITFSATGPQITATNTGGSGLTYDSVCISSENFTSNSKVVHAEVYFDSTSGAGANGTGIGIGFTQDTNPSAPGDITCAAFAATGAGVTVDYVAFMAKDFGVAMTPGVYGIAIDFDMNAGTATYEDTEGNTGSLMVNAGFNNANPVYLVGLCNTTNDLGGTNVGTCNFGNVAFTIGSNTVSWCD